MILVVTEGERAEPALIEELVKLGCYGQHAEIVSYGTNIHTLIAALKSYVDSNDYKESDIDLALVLKEIERKSQARPRNRNFDWEQKFSDILMIFDLDPQDPNFRPQDVKWLVQHFCGDTTEGKIYINYPMFESLFLDEIKKISKDVIERKGFFKEKMHQTKRWYKFQKLQKSDNANRGYAALSLRDVRDFLISHSCFYETITNKEYLDSDMKELLECEMQMWDSKNELICVNTSILSVLDFRPNFIDQIQREFS